MPERAVTAPAVAATIARVLAFCAFVAVTVMASGALLTAPLEWAARMTGGPFRIDGFILLGGGLFATALMTRSIDVRPWQDVGLGRPAWRARRLFEGWTLGMCTIGAACVVLLLAGWLEVVPDAPGSWIAAALRITVGLAAAALGEEVICRGYLLTAVRGLFGPITAIVLTSLLFGVLHLANPGATTESVVLVTMAGMFLGAVRVAFDSLAAAWMAHLAWNWVMAVPLHAPVSGQRFESPGYHLVSSGPEVITGGSWGPEGGLAAALAMIGGMAYLYARRRREES